MSESTKDSSADEPRERRPKSGGKQDKGLFARIALFFRQVVSEIRKVVRPTRRELFTYFGVVIVFVLIMMTIVGVLDLVFGQLALWTFA